MSYIRKPEVPADMAYRLARSVGNTGRLVSDFGQGLSRGLGGLSEHVMTDPSWWRSAYSLSPDTSAYYRAHQLGRVLASPAAKLAGLAGAGLGSVYAMGRMGKRRR
jgi:hypothetical protein